MWKHDQQTKSGGINLWLTAKIFHWTDKQQVTLLGLLQRCSNELQYNSWRVLIGWRPMCLYSPNPRAGRRRLQCQLISLVCCRHDVTWRHWDALWRSWTCRLHPVLARFYTFLLTCCLCHSLNGSSHSISGNLQFLWENYFYLSYISYCFCYMMLCICCYAVFVCLPVTFVNSVKTSNHIFKMFSPSGSQTILHCGSKKTRQLWWTITTTQFSRF